MKQSSGLPKVLRLLRVFIVVHGLSLVEVSGGYSPVAVHGLPTGAWALAGRAWELWPTGLVAQQHVGSSWSRD